MAVACARRRPAQAELIDGRMRSMLSPLGGACASGTGYCACGAFEHYWTTALQRSLRPL